jgi:aminomethyltransferase
MTAPPMAAPPMPTSDAALARVPLDALHRELGARMGAFAGYDMPIQYPMGLKGEHLHTRAHCGLFDVSHMGQLRVWPRDGDVTTLQRELEACLPIDFVDWESHAQRYTLLLNHQGGIEDDLMIVNLGAEVRIVVNAGNREHDRRLFVERCPSLSFDWIDEALVAIQGPAAEAVVAQLDPRATTPRFMEATMLELLGVPCFATRSGYTGEDGFEISIPPGSAESVVRALLEDERVRPAGLGARDTLRLEAGLPLHGHDIGPDTSPVEAQLAFAIARSRRLDGAKAGGFPGAEAILQQFAHGVERKLVGFTSSAGIPIRPPAAIVDGDDQVVGTVTSGTMSPSLGHPILLAYVDAGALRDDGALSARVRDKRPAVARTKLPFVPKRYKR